MSLSSEREFKIRYPIDFMGAQLFIIDPKHARSLKEVVLKGEDPFPLHAGFCKKCIRTYDFNRLYRLTCPHQDEAHGHLILMCDDGSTLIFAPIYSKEFFAEVVNALRGFSVEEKTLIKQTLMEDIAHLPEAMLEKERVLLEDRTQFRANLRYLWAGV